VIISRSAGPCFVLQAGPREASQATAGIVRRQLKNDREFIDGTLVVIISPEIDQRQGGGRRSHIEARPEVMAEAKRLHRASPNTGERRSLRKIAAELATLGHLNVNGRPYSAKSVRSMFEGPAR
jgi:hypothetical protein